MTERSALTGWLAGILLLTVGSASLAQDPVAPDDPPAANLPAAPSLDTPRDILNEVANPAAPTLNAAAPADEIQIPADPLARAAFDVLERNCARCHQAGRIVGRLKPAKDFGFILELDKLAADPHYVTPGNPDGSRLIQMILNKEMPYDVYSEGDMSKAIPSEADETALRDWIASLGDTASSACDRRFVKTDEVVDAMAADLTAVQAARVASTRYITLTHLHNACASIAEMEVYRQATVKLLNSLSRVSDMVKLETVDEARTILRFNLNDLNWQAQDWETILAVYPYATRPPGEAFDALAKATATPLPYVRGDWFAFGAAQPPMYDALLHLPDNFAALEKDLGVDVAANIKRFVAARAGFDESGISVNNRVIERHAIPTGYLWLTYDFATNRERQNVFEHPLGPGEGEFDFRHDGSEVIFSLPNGFQGYYQTNASGGVRLDKGPTMIIRDLSRRDLSVTTGISCMGCHDLGIRPATDQVRETVNAPTLPPPVVEAIEALYPPIERMNEILAKDRDAFIGAMADTGLDPALKLNGVEPINALAKRYEDAVELKLAAAEFDLTGDELLAKLGTAGTADAAYLKRRLEQGLVPRDSFEERFADLVPGISGLKTVDLSAYTPSWRVVDIPRKQCGAAVASETVSVRPADLADALDTALLAAVKEGRRQEARALSQTTYILSNIVYSAEASHDLDPSSEDREVTRLTEEIRSALAEKDSDCRTNRLDEIANWAVQDFRNYFDVGEEPVVLGVFLARAATDEPHHYKLRLFGLNLARANPGLDLGAMPVRIGDSAVRDAENVEFDVRFAPGAQAGDPKLWAGTVTLDRHVSWLMPYERRAYSFVVLPPEASLE